MADYKGLNIKFTADASSATQTLNSLSNELRAAQGNLTGLDSGLKNLKTNGEALNDALKSMRIQELGDAMTAAQGKAQAYQEVLAGLETRFQNAREKLVANRDALEALGDKWESVSSVGEQFSNRVQGTMQAVVSAQEALASCTKGTAEYEQAQERLDDMIEANVAALAQETAALDGVFTAYGTLEGGMNAAREVIESTSRAIDDTNKNMLVAQSEANALAEAHRVLSAQFEASSTGLYQFGESARQYGDSLKSLGDSIASVGDKLSIVSGVALATFGRNVISSTEDFGNAIAQLGGYLDISGAQLDEMREKALYWGKETQFSATEAADAMNQLAKGGMAQAQITGGAMAATMDLAAAGELNMATAAETTVQAMNAFQMSAEDATSIADALAGAANKSTAEVSDLAQGFSQIGGAANMAGWNLNEVVGAMALLADRGYSGAEAGTALKTMLQRLNTNTAKKGMEELGISVYDASGKMISATELVETFSQALDGLTDEDRNAKLLEIFGQRGINSMAALLDEGAESFQTYIAATEEAGYASEMAESRMDKLGWALEFMRGEVETAVVNFGTALAPTIIDVAEALEDALSWFNNLSDGTQTLVANTALAVAGFGPLLSIVGHTASGIGGFISTIGTGAQTLATFAELTKGGGDSVKLFSEALAVTTTPMANTVTGMQQVAEKAALIEQGMTTLATGAVVALAVAVAGSLISAYIDYCEHAELVEDATDGVRAAMERAENGAYSYSEAMAKALRPEEVEEDAERILQSVADLGNSIDDAFKNISIDSTMLEQYVRTIEELSGKGELSAYQLSLLGDAVKGFNDITGASVSIIDDQTGALSAQPEAIRAVVDAYEDYASALAYQELAIEAKKKLAEADYELEKTEDELKTATEAFTEAAGIAGEKLEASGPTIDALKKKQEELTEAQSVAADAYDHYSELAEDAGKAMDDYASALEGVGGATTDNTDATEEDTDALGDLTDATDEAADAQTALSRAIEDATTALKRQNDEVYTAEKRRLDDVYSAQKTSYDQQYDLRKSELDKEYNAQKDAYSKAESAQKEANSKAESELKKSLDKRYDLQKQAYADEYALAKEAYADELAALKSAMSDEYDLRKNQLSSEYDAIKDAYSKQESQIKSALQKRYDTQKEAYSNQLAEYKKQLSAAENALDESNKGRLSEIKSAHSDEESELKKSLDSQYKIRQKEYQKIYKQWQKENSKLLKEAKAANKAETDAFKSATKERVAAIKAEYEEKKRLYALSDGTAEIDAQIKAIEDEQEAEDAARKQREREEKLSELRLAVERAKTKRSRQVAEVELSEYLQQLAEEDADAERQRQIQALKDKRNTIAAETDAVQEGMDAERDARIAAYEQQREDELAALEVRQDAAYELLSEKLSEELELRKEKQDTALEQYREELNAELDAMRERHQSEQDEVSKQMSKQLEQLKEANTKRADAMAAWQSKMLERMSEANAAEVERVKEANATALKQIKAVQEQELKSMKSAQEQQLKDVAAMQDQELKNLASTQTAALENLKEDQERELQTAKEINTQNLQQLKDTNDQSLQKLKETNSQILEGIKSDQTTALTALKREQDDALTKLKNDQADAVTALKRSMEDGKSSVETNATAASKSIKDNATKAKTDTETAANGISSAVSKSTKQVDDDERKMHTEMLKRSNERKTTIPKDADEAANKVTSTVSKSTKQVDDDDKKMHSEMLKRSGESKTKIPQDFETMGSQSESKTRTYTTSIGNLYDTLFNGLGTKAQTGMGSLANAITSEGQKAETNAGTVASGIKGKFDGIDTTSSGRSIVDGVDSGMRERAINVFNTAQEIANGIAERMNNALEVNSPSKVTMRSGLSVDEGLVLGIKRGSRDVMLAAQSLSDGLTDTIAPEFELNEMMLGLVSGVRNRRYELVRELELTVRDVKATFDDINAIAMSGTTRVNESLRNGAAGARGVTVVMNGLTVREDADIDRISERLYQRIEQAERRSL